MVGVMLGGGEGRVSGFRARIVARGGWRCGLVAAAFGALGTAALPPVYFVPFIFVAFSGLVWLIDAVPASRTRQAAWLGWWFGFGHFVPGLYWLANALLLDVAQFGWMVPFAVFGLSAVLGVFTAGSLALYHRAGCRGVAGVLVLALTWTAGEWLRGHVLTGFPWNLISTVWVATPVMMQPASLFGAYGLSIMTVVVAAAPSTLFIKHGRWVGPVVSVVLLAAGYGYGAWRVPADAVAAVPDVRLRLVQPNVPQSLKWDPVARVENFRKSLKLTASPGIETRTVVIWSETAVPFALTDFNPQAGEIREALASVTPPGGLLITGAVRAVREQNGEVRLWNSLFALDSRGEIVASYDKHHLVPFGEYVPWRWLIGALAAPAGSVDFSAGPGPQTVVLPDLPSASPLICYEAIFPGEVVDASARPGWMLNISNDAWFGQSAGPHQHFASARLRAVEEGLPLVRATNDGISAVVDPFGRVTIQLGLGATGVVDANLPSALPATLYARWGDRTLLALIVIFLLTIGLVRHRSTDAAVDT